MHVMMTLILGGYSLVRCTVKSEGERNAAQCLSVHCHLELPNAVTRLHVHFDGEVD